MKNTTWVKGQWNAICDVCGVKYKIGDLRKRWDGFLVCKEDWETRHPMDFIRLPDEKIAVEETRPQPDDVFVSVSYINQYFDSNYVVDIYVADTIL